MPLNFAINNFLTNIYDMATHNKLLGFVDRTTDEHPPTPSPTGVERASRQVIASKLRVNRKPRSESANVNRAYDQEPAYGQQVGVPQGNAVHGGHPMDLEHGQEQENRDKFETSTVGDDFDDTVSQQNFLSKQQNVASVRTNDEYGNDYHRDEAEQLYHQVAQYHNYNDRDLQDDSDPGKDYIDDEPIHLSQPNAAKNKIAGRFNQSGQVNTLANRPKSVVQAAETSRKRVFDEAQLDGTSDGDEYSDEETRMEEQPALQSRPIDRQPVANLHQNGNLNLASIELDYDDVALKNMDYQQLKDESFEASPIVPEQSSEPDVSISERPLLERISHHVEQIRTSDEQLIDKQRSAMAEFFGSLSKDEWEKRGIGF
ncbi:hypothetical protein DID88_005963 [Monilinia fructigena]|uniref:Extracellular mutant protein 11 C-terminal domain-containing protein n=1 Tax=Monilinia fructigena TaxID=38457 RepID=A0A395J3L4_9HELO|nr:hypothetical protein DID88_005963 [Monilinia fructigena]